MKIKFGGINISAPYLPASGCYGYGLKAEKLFREAALKWGALITKTITLNPRDGNRPPRIFEVDGGIINRIGLQNCGLKIFMEEKLPEINRLPYPAVVSIFGENLNEWVELAKTLASTNAAALELNLSCPNLKGDVLARDRKEVLRAVKNIKKNCSLPIWVKINAVDSPAELSVEFEKLSVDAIVCSNSISASVNFNGRIYDGGLSGPAIKPLALQAVKNISSKTGIDIAACGGIKNFSDVKDYRLAGAKAFIIGSALFKNPDTVNLIAEEEKSEKKRSTENG